ncbi:MAG: threonine efflux protein [Alphaproteobacteria bacterium]|nr:MAG: threonine efflux protein [Alphaproteobacteria bacterium]
MLHAYVITIVGVALAQAAPGPNFLAVVSAGLGQGRRAALFTVLGVVTGMLAWGTLVALGLATVLALYPDLLTAMKIVGGAYLIYMAARALVAMARSRPMRVAAQQRALTAFGAWWRGLLVIMTNPKAALMWTAVGTFLFGSGLEPWQVAAFAPMAAASGTVIYGGYGLLFTTNPAVRAYQRFAGWIELAFGAAFGVLGGRLLIDGMREMRS